MRSAGRFGFVRVLPWVICLALGAAAHLVWALDAWWRPAPSTPPVIVHVSPPPPVSSPVVVVHAAEPPVRRTESPAASDPELVAMLVDAHVRCDGRTCTIDPRLVEYLRRPHRHSTGRRTPGRLVARPRAAAISASP
jgi:hypothetical protein